MIPIAPPVTVLLYHNILAAGSPPHPDPGCIPVDTFEEHVNSLFAAGFDCVSLAEAFAIAVDPPPISGSTKPKFCVTFDDGLAGLSRYLPRFVQPLRPTVFLITGFVGKSNSWNARAPYIERHLSLEEIRQMAAGVVAMENHGPDHQNLIKFNRRQLRNRARSSISWFQEKLGRSPSYLAYPYGACTPLVSEVAADFFLGAVSVNHGSWSGPKSRYALNCISVPACLSGGELVSIVCHMPERRWEEIERRAPWRKASIGGSDSCLP
jgi:peptidoglycan/xylan/chitin deacetylase (PgdA/CDA1 family)